MINREYLIEGHATPNEWAACYAYLLTAPGGSLWTVNAPDIEAALTRPRLSPAPDVIGAARAKASAQDAERQQRLEAIRQKPRRHEMEPARPGWVTPSPLPAPRTRHSMVDYLRTEGAIKPTQRRGKGAAPPPFIPKRKPKATAAPPGDNPPPKKRGRPRKAKAGPATMPANAI